MKTGGEGFVSECIDYGCNIDVNKVKSSKSYKRVCVGLDEKCSERV